jgi:hypothetical protein
MGTVDNMRTRLGWIQRGNLEARKNVVLLREEIMDYIVTAVISFLVGCAVIWLYKGKIDKAGK